MKATMKGGSLCWVAVEKSTQFGVQNVRTLRDLPTPEVPQSFHIKDREDLLSKYKSLGAAELKKKMLEANYKAEEIELSLRICAVMLNTNNVVAVPPTAPLSVPTPAAKGKPSQPAFDPFLSQNNRKRTSSSPPKTFIDQSSSFPAVNKFVPTSSTRPSKQPKSSKTSVSEAPGLDTRLPTTSVQIKFRDGSSSVCLFNSTQTVGELRKYVEQVVQLNPLKGGGDYQLVVSYPHRVLDNPSLTLQSAGLHRATVSLQAVGA